jgi:RimJ/RimL family protein N-acetyltransferase
MDCTPFSLEGQHVRLEPLRQEHLAEIQAAAADGELWKLYYTSVPNPDNTQKWLDTALQWHTEEKAIPFVVRHKASGAIIGSTRYCNIDHNNKRLEIGYTWYAQSHQRSAVNTECKLLLLGHAFEVFGCIAVELRTDWMNKRSQAAIERLGAKRDALLRNHQLMPDGRIRDTVVFSIIQGEWPGVKRNLQFLRDRYTS